MRRITKSIKNALPALYLAAGIAFGQNSELNLAENLLQKDNIDSTLTVLNNIDLTAKSDYQNARFYTIRAQAYLALDQHDLSFEDYLNAKRYWTVLDSVDNVAASNLSIIEVLSHQRKSKLFVKPFLDEYVEYASNSGNPSDKATAFSKIAVRHLHADNFEESINFFDSAINIAKTISDTVAIMNYTFNKAVVYNANNYKQYTKALNIFKELEPIFIRDSLTTYLAYNYNNQAKSYRGLGDYNNAIKYYAKADSIPLANNTIKTKRIFYENMAQTFDEAGDYNKATMYLKLLLAINDSISKLNQDAAIADSDTKYRASEKEKQLLVEQQLSSRNKNIAFGLGGSLLLGGIIAFLLYRNTKRKQRIAEQETEIEIQKTEKLLKEQELNTIDAMIAGQEKERQRLASDLHDSVGATLSAAKMQFEHLKKHKGKLQNEDELYARTQDLLEDAYTEVRAMAHVKNSGVIAKNGLLPAVQKLAKNVSATKTLQVEVHDFGLEERLESTLEITIFRIIQELVTNIIKHAQASEANISITQHHDSINIMVEDNGKGFSANRLPQREGMGLSNIERRIEHLEGNLDVDSQPDKGTNIIIDIPL